MVVSDGQFYIPTCMPSKACEHYLANGTVKQNTVVRLTECSLKDEVWNAARVVLASGIEVVQQWQSRIGDTTDISKNADAQQRHQQAVTAAAAGGGGGRSSSHGGGARVYDAVRSLNPSQQVDNQGTRDEAWGQADAQRRWERLQLHGGSGGRRGTRSEAVNADILLAHCLVVASLVVGRTLACCRLVVLRRLAGVGKTNAKDD